jgi:hypothetical protein
MILINHLGEFRPANVDFVGHLLVAADIEGTFTLRPIDGCSVALQRSKPNGTGESFIFPRETFHEATFNS